MVSLSGLAGLAVATLTRITNTSGQFFVAFFILLGSSFARAIFPIACSNAFWSGLSRSFAVCRNRLNWLSGRGVNFGVDC